MSGGYTGEVRKIGFFIMSYFFVEGGGVHGDGSEGLWLWDLLETRYDFRYYQYQKICG